MSMTQIISTINAQPLNFKEISPADMSGKTVSEIGSGAGIGLVYFQNIGFAWVHAGGMPGYESFYLYNPCQNIYLVIMYNVKPREPFIFVKIAENILKVINHGSSKTVSIKNDIDLCPSFFNKSGS